VKSGYNSRLIAIQVAEQMKLVMEQVARLTDAPVAFTAPP